jgi:hypothetical protein
MQLPSVSQSWSSSFHVNTIHAEVASLIIILDSVIYVSLNARNEAEA